MKKLIIAGLLLVALTATGCDIQKKQSSLSIEDAKVLAQDFINNNLMQPGSTVSIKEVIEDNGMYKVTVNLPNDQEIVSYMTKDGKKFFPQVMDIEPKTEEAAADDTQAKKQTPPPTNAPKQEKPNVELFVMSHCPYGTQIEKGILPVLDTLGDKIDFELKFCDYIMHGKKEIDEQLVQYCVQKEEPNKFSDYLTCFLEEGNGDDCLTKTKINTGKIDSCVASTDKTYNVSKNFEDKSTYKGRFPTFDVYKEDNEKYGVGGSPTLVINGATIRSGRDSATLLASICSGFENPPAECNEELSSASPSPGFGFGTASGGGSAASCGE